MYVPPAQLSVSESNSVGCQEIKEHDIQRRGECVVTNMDINFVTGIADWKLI